ncbi:ubiquitin carboxyl-terminal hydrolase 37-like [Myripristis murdjan]|uniref:ubiquitin carboxyl-terminal hydrolase 37-like n=1 Tax=Myripristis murdjan TaxID=586833 RepID=UPI0011762F71|nr:ubiquitin carboxyl-terminal hydrolase 37-like [Myripristis murdjan]
MGGCFSRKDTVEVDTAPVPISALASSAGEKTPSSYHVSPSPSLPAIPPESPSISRSSSLSSLLQTEKTPSSFQVSPSPSPPATPSESPSISRSSSLSSLHLSSLFDTEKTPSSFRVSPSPSPLATPPESPSISRSSSLSSLHLSSLFDTEKTPSGSPSSSRPSSPTRAATPSCEESSTISDPSSTLTPLTPCGPSGQDHTTKPAEQESGPVKEAGKSFWKWRDFFLKGLFNKRKSQQKKLGLPNIGNTCFISATLQGLYNTESLCSAIMRQEGLWSPQAETPLKLQRYFGELHKARLGKPSYKGKRRLLSSLKSYMAAYNEEYDCNSQQDAHEFFLLLLMAMKSEGAMLQETSFVPDYVCPVETFEFHLQCVRTCSSCGQKIYQEEEHNNLSLDVSSSVEDSLQLYFTESELECRCWQCSARQATTVRHFLTLPRVLVLHIKRFQHDRGELRKVDASISIPRVLSLAPHCGQQRDEAAEDQLSVTKTRAPTGSLQSSHTSGTA